MKSLHILFGTALAVLLFGVVIGMDIKPAYAATVQVPITLNMRTGSSTPEDASAAFTVTCAGGGGTHDGRPAQQTFTCNESSTVTITTPIDTGTSRFRFSDESVAKSFTSCAAPGPCTDTSYSDVTRQYRNGFIANNFVGDRWLTATRTQYGISGIEPINGTIPASDYRLTLDGIDDTVTTANTASLNAAKVSIFFWIKPVDFSNTYVVGYKGTTGSTFDYEFYYSGAGKITVGAKTGVGAQTTSVATNAMTVGSWNHVGIVIDGSTIQHYLNGSPNGSTSLVSAGNIVNQPGGITIGNEPGSSFYCKCQLEDYLTYNTNLSSTQAGQIYNGTSISTNRVLYFRFNEGSGTSVIDHSGNSNTGTINGSAKYELPVWTDEAKSVAITNPVVLGTHDRYYTLSRVGYLATGASNNTLNFDHQYKSILPQTGLDGSRWATATTTFASQPSVTQPVYGSASANNNYLLFDGYNDHVADSGGVSLNSGSAGTWGGWFRLDREPGATKWVMGRQHSYGLLANTTKINCPIATVNNSWTDKFFSATVTVGKWHHAMCVYNGSTLEAFLDGSSLGTIGSISGNIVSNVSTPSTFIGGNRHDITVAEPSGANGIKGAIRDIRIFNVAKTSAQIGAMRLGGTDTTGLQAWWKIDEGSGTSLTDSSGNGHVGTATNGPTWDSGVWTDASQTISIAQTVVISTDQERFKSYDATASWIVSTAGQTRTLTYQHEYSILYRVNEAHLGYIFAPMPKGTFSGPITASNGTQFTVNFDTQVIDDYLQPSAGRIWTGNGTTNWSNIKWRDLIVNATGSRAITGYGNFDINAASKHYGYEPDRHFRVAVNSGTINANSVAFSRDAATFQFNATASGQQNIKLEYLPALYQGVNDVKVNGSSLSASSYSITTDNTLSPNVAILTITNINFGGGTVEVFIQLVASPSSGGPGGGGGGGGGGGSSAITPQQPPSLPVGVALGLKVTMPDLTVGPGKSVDTQMIVEWAGATRIEITEIRFLDKPEWFTVSETIPMTASLTPGGELRKVIPITVTVPADAKGNWQDIKAQVTASAGATTTTQQDVFRITFGSNANIALYALAGIGVAGIVAVAVQARGGKRRIPRRRRR